MHTTKDETLCPECDERGKAMCIVVGRGLRTVHYQCFTCRERWMQMQVIPHDHILRLVFCAAQGW
jgi:hypothetical protein